MDLDSKSIMLDKPIDSLGEFDVPLWVDGRELEEKLVTQGKANAAAIAILVRELREAEAAKAMAGAETAAVVRALARELAADEEDDRDRLAEEV